MLFLKNVNLNLKVLKMEKISIGIVGSGAMGGGIAEVAAKAGHPVVVFDTFPPSLDKFSRSFHSNLDKLVEKQKISAEAAALAKSSVHITNNLQELAGCKLVIEAIVEDLDIKKEVFSQLEIHCGEDAILASNTSSLSIASISAACKNPGRVLGIHFFNPATIMPLVEIIPGISTDPEIVQTAKTLVDSWGKMTVLAKDTPGFIVNRIARPFYGEAIRIYEEGLADIATIDWAMKTFGAFRMGPFELMDFIGNDINYAVTETVFREFWCDPRYKPSFTQKRLVEAGRLGRKSGQGYYRYDTEQITPDFLKDEQMGKTIFQRILVMLINEAADALYLRIASREDIDMAMTKGVNYPKGLLKWADETGIAQCLELLDELYHEYHEDRYRASTLLRKMAREHKTFYA